MAIPLEAEDGSVVAEVLAPTDKPRELDNPVSTPLHHYTPFFHSPPLSAGTGHNIYLKLDCDQPSGSFKLRGIGSICQSALTRYGAGNTHLISSSGGNAGLAVAYAASRARVGCTIFVPASTEADVVAKLRGNGAKVVIGGDSWDQADAAARELVEVMEGAVYVHPFEGDELVAGHSSLVDEVYEQFDATVGDKGELDAIVSSVGGGGLIRGIMHGLARRKSGARKPTLVAVQNFGVDSFNRSFDQHLTTPNAKTLPSQVVCLDAIQSKCTSMGTKKCSLSTLHDAIRYHAASGVITTLTVTDDLSASACWQFAERSADLCPDRRSRMVELSCASALTPFFHPWILDSVIGRSDALRAKVERGEKLNIVIEVCGGSKVNETLLQEYKQAAGQMGKKDRIRINGVDILPSA